jgi:hypothetical protein
MKRIALLLLGLMVFIILWRLVDILLNLSMGMVIWSAKLILLALLAIFIYYVLIAKNAWKVAR